MVTSVNSSSLAALLAQETALANRSSTAAQPSGGDTAASDPAQDPAVIYSGQDGSAGLSAILSLQASLNKAASISDVGMSAGQTISDLLATMREKVVAAQTSGTPDQQSTLDADYQQLLQTVDQIAGSASFQGVSMLDGSSSSDLQFSAGLTGDTTLSLTPQDFTTAGPVIGLAGTSLTGSSDDLASLLDQVDAASGSVSTQLSQMGGQSDQIQAQLGVVSQLQSSLAGSGGADLDADTARLQALSVQQMLASMSSGVVTQGPQALLSLFRSE
jgi:flagellin